MNTFSITGSLRLATASTQAPGAAAHSTKVPSFVVIDEWTVKGLENVPSSENGSVTALLISQSP